MSRSQLPATIEIDSAVAAQHAGASEFALSGREESPVDRAKRRATWSQWLGAVLVSTSLLAFAVFFCGSVMISESLAEHGPPACGNYYWDLPEREDGYWQQYKDLLPKRTEPKRNEAAAEARRPGNSTEARSMDEPE